MNNRRIEPLDRSESRAQGIAGSAATSLVREKVVDAPEFAQLIAAAQRDRKGKDKVGKTILHELVSEFIKPVVADPQTLSSDRAIAILEQLLNSVLPQLKESENSIDWQAPCWAKRSSSAAICARAVLRLPKVF
jgi:hypothetical protein